VQTVGEILRSEREKKGLSIKEIELATSIRTIYISAIEEGNYDIIPGEVYLKGFIRNYSNILGLDGQHIVDLYRQSQQNSITSNEEIVPNVNNSSVKQPNKKTNHSIKWLTVSLLVICVVGGAWWWLLDNPKSIQEPKVDKQQVQSAPIIPSQVIKEQSAMPPTPAIKPVTIIAKYTDQCWTSVTADNKMIYEGTVHSGETLTWTAEQNITIKAGNAGGVDIVYNGQSLGKLGTKGEVIVKNFSAPK